MISKTGSVLLAALLAPQSAWSLAPPPPSLKPTTESRRGALQWFLGQATIGLVAAAPAAAFAEVDVDSYLKAGGVSMPMGVSGQGGKMRPETGVVFRDGSEVSRDPRNGDVLAEILLKKSSSTTKSDNNKLPVLATFSSPWPLASGATYDVECRDGSTGDGVYLAVSANVNGKSISELSNQFFQEQLFSPTGRFSFYGAPTDIKIKTAAAVSVSGNYRVMDVDFSILSQSTGAEVPRKARVVATIPEDSTQAVMLVGSASAARWRKGSDQKIASIMESFRATPAPTFALKIRAKES